jgi:hypothetical protein
MAILNKNQAVERGTLRSVGEILRSEMPHKLALHMKIADIIKSWVDVVGSPLASRSFPVVFEYESDGNSVYLLVHVASPAAAQRVLMLSDKISGKLKELWQIEIIGVRVKVI